MLPGWVPITCCVAEALVACSSLLMSVGQIMSIKNFTAWKKRTGGWWSGRSAIGGAGRLAAGLTRLTVSMSSDVNATHECEGALKIENIWLIFGNLTKPSAKPSAFHGPAEYWPQTKDREARAYRTADWKPKPRPCATIAAFTKRQSHLLDGSAGLE